ncbi:MAG: hypothetical protein KAW41_06870 [Candidatus Diapherotrites archaeon]|nr:hypothetical protein [Candidatus Diapherotrites archaeon]
MIEAFFAALLGIGALLCGVYSYSHDRKNLWFLAVLLSTSLLALTQWEYAAGFFLLLFASLWVKSFSRFITASMFSAIMLSFFFLNVFINHDVAFLPAVAVVSVFSLCFLAIIALFEDNLRRFLFYSNSIQIIFVVLDLAVAKMLGKLGALGTIQIFNYFFAGFALFFAIGVLAIGKTKISELEGSYYTSKWNDIAATIACLSLAGLPAFNMFVSEWALFTASYAVMPIVTILGIFAALLLFVMYYKLVYRLLIGEGAKVRIPRSITAMNLALAALCIILGVLPTLQFTLLEALM